MCEGYCRLLVVDDDCFGEFSYFPESKFLISAVEISRHCVEKYK